MLVLCDHLIDLIDCVAYDLGAREVALVEWFAPAASEPVARPDTQYLTHKERDECQPKDDKISCKCREDADYDDIEWQ